MMIWKGKGILVPVIFFTIAFLVSFMVAGEATIGNAVFMRWTNLLSGLLLLLIGYGFISKENVTEETQNGLWNRINEDSFFFTPVIIWGVLLIVLGLC